MKTELLNNGVRVFIANEGKLLTDKDHTFYSKEVFPANSLAESDFEEVDETDAPIEEAQEMIQSIEVK